MRSEWAALPESVVTAICDRVGGTQVMPTPDGDHAEIAATVIGPHEKVFVKAASSEFGIRSLRYELLVSRAVAQPYSPRVEWDVEIDGWLVVGFEHVDGRRADLSPGSPDLSHLALVVEELHATTAPADLPWLSPTARLGFAHPAMLGETLVHTDLNPTNLMVTPHGVRIVDWAMASRAAPWVELALLVPWLVGGGHTPEQAETWLARMPAWSATAPEVLDDFASRNATKWSLKAGQGAARWMCDLADWTGRWSAYRLEKSPGSW